jgi:hypothetical protein
MPLKHLHVVRPCRASFYLTHLQQQEAEHARDLSAAKAAAADNDHTAAPAAAAAATPAVGLYAPYLLECIERDGSQTVGLGLPMWLLVLAFVLLSGNYKLHLLSHSDCDELQVAAVTTN